MSADKREKGRRRRPPQALRVNASGERDAARNARHDAAGARQNGARRAASVPAQITTTTPASMTGERDDAQRRRHADAEAAAPSPAQRATELAREARALAAEDAHPTAHETNDANDYANVGDSVTFAAREAPEIPVASDRDGLPGESEPAGSGGNGGDVTEEASVTLDQEQRDLAVADEAAPDERPTVIGRSLMAGPSDPDPQSGPETTRRAARPPRPTRPVQAYSPPAAQNSSPEAEMQSPQPAPDQPAEPTPPAVPDDDVDPAATLPDGPAILEPLASLTPMVSLGAIAPAAFAEEALAEATEESEELGALNNQDAADAASELDEPTTPDLSAASASPEGDRLQAINLPEQPLTPPPTDATSAEQGSQDAAQPNATPYPQAQQPPTPPNAQMGRQAPHPPQQLPQQPPRWPGQPGQALVAPPPPVMPGAPLAPLGAQQFGAAPPPYQGPNNTPLGAPAEGADAQLPSHAPWAVAASWGESSLSGPNTAAGMSYLFWWLSGIFVYFNERQNRFVRFHAMQSILLTGALTIVSVLLFTIFQLFDDVAAATHQPAIAHIGQGIVIIGYALGVILPWFGAMVAAWSGTYLRIPFIGDYAERFAAPPREVYPDSPPY